MIIVGYNIYLLKAVKQKILLNIKIRRTSTFCYDVKEKSRTFKDICDREYFDYFSCANIFKH